MTIRELSTGIQHIAVPSFDFDKTVAFYESLGFVLEWRSGPERATPLGFLRLHDLVIETYANGKATGAIGAIDHIAINVTDAEAAREAVIALGYQPTGEMQYLNFYENGVRCFKILGPNNEQIEFNQKL